MAEQTILGKKVVIRDRFPAGQFHSLHKGLRSEDLIGDRTFEEQIGPYVGSVLQWEFPGDPGTLAGWAELDTFSELPAVVRAVNTVVAAKLQALVDEAKN